MFPQFRTSTRNFFKNQPSFFFEFVVCLSKCAPVTKILPCLPVLNTPHLRHHLVHQGPAPIVCMHRPVSSDYLLRLSTVSSISAVPGIADKIITIYDTARGTSAISRLCLSTFVGKLIGDRASQLLTLSLITRPMGRHRILIPEQTTTWMF